MKNSVIASVEFYFKGEKFSPSIKVDLDIFFQSHQHIGALYTDLGREIGIDLYRHEYDVMEAEPIVFSHATGIAAEYISDGAVDWENLEKVWQSQSSIRSVQHIANKFFNVENLDDNPKLAAALLDAYQAGCDDALKKHAPNISLNEGFYG